MIDRHSRLLSQLWSCRDVIQARPSINELEMDSGRNVHTTDPEIARLVQFDATISGSK